VAGLSRITSGGNLHKAETIILAYRLSMVSLIHNAAIKLSRAPGP
jgi:hypothetical protein